MIKGERPSLYSYCKHVIGCVVDHIKYGSTITDYFELTFYNKIDEEKRKYVTRKFHYEFLMHVDNVELFNKLLNKTDMYEVLKESVNRKQLRTDRCTYEEFNMYVNEVPVFLYKPDDGTCGNGIRLIKSNEVKLETLYKEIIEQPGVLDEIIVQHHEMKKLNPSSVNTIRLFTFRIGYKIYFIGAALRMGTKGFIDNYSAGGLVGSIDLNTVCIKDLAEDMYGRRYSKHPVSGVQFANFRIPNWDEAVEFIFNIAKNYPLNYVAWDLAILENGFTIVEANAGGMVNVIQIAGAGGKNSLYRKLYDEYKKYESKYISTQKEDKVFEKIIC